jgi:signal transduction histidine kinase
MTYAALMPAYALQECNMVGDAVNNTEEFISAESTVGFAVQGRVDCTRELFHRGALHCDAMRGVKEADHAIPNIDRHLFMRPQVTRLVNQRSVNSEAPSIAKLPLSGPKHGPNSEIHSRALLMAARALANEASPKRLREILASNINTYANAELGMIAVCGSNGFTAESAGNMTASVGNVFVKLGSDDEGPVSVPHTVLLSVANTRQSILLDDAANHGDFTLDAVIMRRNIRSLLCIPLLKRTELVAILYLERADTLGAFEADRIALIEVLASQLVGLIENMRLRVCVSGSSRSKNDEALSCNPEDERENVSGLATAGHLAVAIVHEVSQPLTSIATGSGAALRWLGRETPDLDEVRDALTRVHSDSVRARDTIRGLYALARKSTPAFCMFDLNDVIKEIIAAAHPGIDNSCITVDKSGLRGRCFVRGNRTQLSQVVHNLVANAIEAMEEVKDQPRRLTISTSRTRDLATFVVEDTGAGLRVGNCDTVFTPLVTTKSGGLGVGLSICRAIISGHGGQLRVSPRFPHGTRFEASISCKP